MSIQLSIIFPAYNEENRIREAIKKAATSWGTAWGKCEIIIVENGSTDKTTAMATEEALNLARTSVHNLKIKILHSRPGKGAAVRLGLEHARGKYILITDVDLSTPLYEIVKLQHAINSDGADLAIGSRKLKGSIVFGLTYTRRLSSDIFAALAMPLTPGIRDTQCGFKLLTQSAANKIGPLLTMDGFAYDVEMIHAARQQGLTVKEVPVTWVNDDRSTVKLFRDSLKMARDLIKIWVNHARGHYLG